MNRKTIILGAILAAFMMLMIPNISAVNEQVKEETLDLNLMNNLENLQTIGLLKDIFWIISGLLFIAIGIVYYILAFTGTAAFMTAAGITAVASAITNIIYSIIGRNNPLEIILDGVIGSAGGFVFAILCGLFYMRAGIYMIVNKESPDEDTFKEWPLFNFLLNLMGSGGDI